MNHLYKTAAAVASAAFLAACGGSGGPSEALQSSAAQPPASTAPDDEGRSFSDMTQSLRAEAQQHGITRTLYSLSGQLGAYGQTLIEDGWTVIDASPSEVPSGSGVIVYVNSSDAGAQNAELIRFLAGFAGVLVIDSDETRGMPADEDTVAGRATAMSLQEESTEAGAAPAYYLTISGGQAKYAPSATALVTSSTSNSITPVLVQEDGGINGSSVAGREDLIDLTIVALDNLKKASEPSGMVRPMGFSSTRTNWDRVVDLNYTADNWNVIGRAFVEGFKEGSGSRHFVAVEIDTGNNITQCYVLGKECGIYPQSRSAIITTERPSTSRWKTISYATQFSARATVYPAIQVMEYRPSRTSWTATEAVNTDSYEVVWSEGFSVGVSAGASTAQSFSIGPSASYSKSTTHRRRMHRWDGDGGIASSSWTDGGVTWQSHEAYSGVKIKNDYRYDFVGVKAGSWSSTAESGFETAMRDSQLRALYCYGTGKTWDEKAKPRMSYEGWNPSLGAMFEVPANRVRASTNNTINVKVGFRLGRQIREYEAVSNQNCFRSPGSYGYRSYSGYRLVGHSDKNGDVMVFSSAWREYNRTLTLTLFPSSFTN